MFLFVGKGENIISHKMAFNNLLKQMYSFLSQLRPHGEVRRPHPAGPSRVRGGRAVPGHTQGGLRAGALAGHDDVGEDIRWGDISSFFYMNGPCQDLCAM